MNKLALIFACILFVDYRSSVGGAGGGGVTDQLTTGLLKSLNKNNAFCGAVTLNKGRRRSALVSVCGLAKGREGPQQKALTDFCTAVSLVLKFHIKAAVKREPGGRPKAGDALDQVVLILIKVGWFV